jgi:hypothetical protein
MACTVRTLSSDCLQRDGLRSTSAPLTPSVPTVIGGSRSLPKMARSGLVDALDQCPLRPRLVIANANMTGKIMVSK